MANLCLVFFAFLLAGCATPKHEGVQRNRRMVHCYFEEWANRGDESMANRLIATNVVLRSPPNVLHGLKEYKTRMTEFHAAFPDLRYTVEDQIAEGDKTVVRWTLGGTQLGKFLGQPPSGKRISVTGISIFRIAGGKIQEITVNMDRIGLMEQLGWVLFPPQLLP